MVAASNTTLAPRKLHCKSISGKKLKTEMEMLQWFFFGLFTALVLTNMVHAQDQSGFISIDCGLPDNASYNDPVTYLYYKSDTAFIDTGISKRISSEFLTIRQLQYVRSFPEGERNCYKIALTRDLKYLIRATFMYGNYDGLNKLPSFDLHLGPNKWVSVKIANASLSYSPEIIHVTTRNYIFVCLLDTGSGTPFLSSLELRPLKNQSYNTQSGSLVLHGRFDFGSNTDANVRFPEDIHDRIWHPYSFLRWKELQNDDNNSQVSQNGYELPSIVMGTAITPANENEPLSFSIDTIYEGTNTEYYAYMHFAEVVKLQANESWEFDIDFNGKKWYGPLVPEYLISNTIFSPSALNGGQYNFSISKTEHATLPPIINAIEIYYVLELLQSQSHQEDVDAIINIKSTYRIKRNWEGDPCAPQTHLWEGLNCNYDDSDMPRIISLNLSSSGLTGEITPHISHLALLQSLDLSNNSLTGSVPDFLSQLPSLKFLNISGNELIGSVPPALLERSNKNSLVLSAVGNPNLCVSFSGKKEKKTTPVVPVVASIAAVFIVMAALFILFWNFKRRKQHGRDVEDRANNPYDSPDSKNRHFTYSEVLKITNNFERTLGRGGFGTVYNGYLDGNEVAVKMLSPSSVQGCKQFQAEVQLLLRVHHRNLTTLVGFCHEGTNMALIYEYMANGDLEKHLSGTNRNVLSWEMRLQIAVEAAKGLEYLHNGSKPPIVHRDVKTSNILLNNNFLAKLADFGLSRPFPVESGTYLSTDVVGTPGYLDPEYSETYRLTEKSDVYSFGIVLLRIITGRPVIGRRDARLHLSQWVRALIGNGDIESIADPRLGGDFGMNSIWKAVEIAMACVSPTSTGRPNMRQVVNELNECLAEEMAKTKERNGIEFKGFTGIFNESTPLAR